jgi:prepilin-type N-terminal cleavage/methylation domain-containing protein
VSRRRAGFTLFELVLVLALVAILAAISYPSMNAMYASIRITEAGDQVRAAWARARARAMNEAVPYRFGIIPNQGNFRIAPDLPDYWAGKGDLPPPSDPANPPLVLEGAVTKGVRLFALKSAPTGGDSEGDTVLPPEAVNTGAYVTVATFLPDGTAREDVELRLQTQGSRPLVLRLRGLTGVIITRWL